MGKPAVAVFKRKHKQQWLCSHHPTMLLLSQCAWATSLHLLLSAGMQASWLARMLYPACQAGLFGRIILGNPQRQMPVSSCSNAAALTSGICSCLCMPGCLCWAVLNDCPCRVPAGRVAFIYDFDETLVCQSHSNKLHDEFNAAGAQLHELKARVAKQQQQQQADTLQVQVSASIMQQQQQQQQINLEQVQLLLDRLKAKQRRSTMLYNMCRSVEGKVQAAAAAGGWNEQLISGAVQELNEEAIKGMGLQEAIEKGWTFSFR